MVTHVEGQFVGSGRLDEDAWCVARYQKNSGHVVIRELVMDIMWPISQSQFHVSFLCSLK